MDFFDGFKITNLFSFRLDRQFLLIFTDLNQSSHIADVALATLLELNFKKNTMIEKNMVVRMISLP